MVATMVPDDTLTPSVLPTDRLLPSGVLRPELRVPMRRIADTRNALTIVVLYLHAAAVIGGALWIGHPAVYAVSFVLMGPVFARLLILNHEAAHRMLFTNRRVNDWVGKWLLAYPAFTPIDAYRRGHMAHHREEFGPDEPDLAFYRGYPTTRASLRRKLTRDAVGISGYKNLVPLFRALTKPSTRRVAASILGVQVLMIVVCVLAGVWWVYPVLWFGPWMTVWRVINRLRSIAEHGGMTRDDDRRRTTHVVRQRWLARWWIVPYHTGWHLAHHVDMGVPWRNLPAFHAELVRAGYVTPGLEYPSYAALWRALSSRTDAAS